MLSLAAEPARGHAQNAFVASLREGVCELFAIESGHLPRIEALMQQYRNLPMDLTDASLVILAEHLGHGRILSTDERDFRTYRWKRHQPYQNLLAADPRLALAASTPGLPPLLALAPLARSAGLLAES